MGYCGYRHEEVLNLTYREYLQKNEWYNKSEQHAWERTRYIAWVMYQQNPYIKKGSRPKRPQDLFPIGEENIQRKIPKQSTEQKIETRGFFDSIGLEVIN